MTGGPGDDGKPSESQLGAGFIQPFAGGTAMAGQAAKGRESHEDKPDGFPLSVCTRYFSKQLDSDTVRLGGIGTGISEPSKIVPSFVGLV